MTVNRIVVDLVCEDAALLQRDASKPGHVLTL